jgi:hypothetical protein
LAQAPPAQLAAVVEQALRRARAEPAIISTALIAAGNLASSAEAVDFVVNQSPIATLALELLRDDKSPLVRYACLGLLRNLAVSTPARPWLLRAEHGLLEACAENLGNFNEGLVYYSAALLRLLCSGNNAVCLRVSTSEAIREKLVAAARSDSGHVMAEGSRAVATILRFACSSESVELWRTAGAARVLVGLAESPHQIMLNEALTAAAVCAAASPAFAADMRRAGLARVMLGLLRRTDLPSALHANVCVVARHAALPGEADLGDVSEWQSLVTSVRELAATAVDASNGLSVRAAQDAISTGTM